MAASHTYTETKNKPQQPNKKTNPKPWGQGPKVDNFGGVQNKIKYNNVFLVHFPNHNTLLASSNLQVRDVSKHFLQRHCSSEFSFFSKPLQSLLYYLPEIN